MTDRIVTYHSINSAPNAAWTAFVEIDGRQLNIRFSAATEDEVKRKVRDFWAKDKAQREENRARRAESKAKRKVTEE